MTTDSGKKPREHIEDDNGSCWCNPELSYVDEFTGVKVWVHKSDEELTQ